MLEMMSCDFSVHFIMSTLIQISKVPAQKNAGKCRYIQSMDALSSIFEKMAIMPNESLSNPPISSLQGRKE